jgi:hypothetical protein
METPSPIEMTYTSGWAVAPLVALPVVNPSLLLPLPLLLPLLLPLDLYK